MPAFRSVVSVLVRELGDFSLHPQGRPCGRPPAAAVLGRQPTATGAGRLNASALRRSARRATEYPVDNDAGLLMESAT
jgi:hypothetical protein